jgi:hypothetical protein
MAWYIVRRKIEANGLLSKKSKEILGPYFQKAPAERDLKSSLMQIYERKGYQLKIEFRDV